MNFYIDFEANNANKIHEIISMGVVSETGDTFYSLVRPHSKLSEQIIQLTHISQEEADLAPSIENVMSRFFNWFSVITESKSSDAKFFTYGDSDKRFIQSSKFFVSDAITLDKLEYIYDRIQQVDEVKIAKKFNRNTIKLQSAYLTMRASFNEPVKEFHNALDDAEMLKYVWENIDNYEFPENGKVVKVPNEKGNSPKKAAKFQVPIKVWTIDEKKGYKEWIFPNIAAASGIFSGCTKMKKRLYVMNRILESAKIGKPYMNKHIEFISKEENK